MLLLASCGAWAQREGFGIREIDDATMQRMQGKSYPKGCLVKREELRYVTVLHYDEKGAVQHGELVCHKSIAQDLVEIFEALYEAKYPISRMVLIDEYGGDDERSMQANNTSCFNYRVVAGSKTLSKHARGLAIDINPLYNPYVRTRNGKQLVSPDGSRKWAANRSKTSHRMIITRDDLCLKLFKQHGFKWGGDWRSLKDYQHFEK